MNNIKHEIEDQIARWDRLGSPCLLDRFILRNGREGIAQARPRGMRKMADKQCFRNAAVSVRMGFHYVEGYAMAPYALGMLVHHAWLEEDDGRVIDLTWKRPEDCQYFGVRFDQEELSEELLRTRVYGLLVQDDLYNDDFMFRQDPGLKAFFEDFKKGRKAAAACRTA